MPLISALSTQLLDEEDLNLDACIPRLVRSHAKQLAIGIREVLTTKDSDVAEQAENLEVEGHPQVMQLRQRRPDSVVSSRIGGDTSFTHRNLLERSEQLVQRTIADHSNKTLNGEDGDNEYKDENWTTEMTNIKKSRAFASMRQKMYLLVSPNVLQYIEKEMVSRTKHLGPHYTVLHVAWELPQCCEQELDDDWEFTSLLTVTGTESQAYATMCGEYMKEHWPQTSVTTLAALEAAIRHSKAGIYSNKYYSTSY